MLVWESLLCQETFEMIDQITWEVYPNSGNQSVEDYEMEVLTPNVIKVRCV